MQPVPPANIYVTQEGGFALTGELTFSSVPSLWRKSQHLFAEAISGMQSSDTARPREIVVDLGEVIRTDSAGLALMIEWLRQTSAHEISITFQNIPQQMRDIANLAEVDFLFQGLKIFSG